MFEREEILAADPEAFTQGHVMKAEVAQRNLLDIKEIFDSMDIKFWLWFGTFLGAYRDGMLIPWDGDTDLAICVADIYKLLRSEKLFNQKGFKFALTLIYRYHEHTDISLFYPCPSNLDKQVAGPLEVDADAFAANAVQFLGQEWPILSNPEKWLRYLYGDNWRIPTRDFGTPGIPLGAEGPVVDHHIMMNLGQNESIVILEELKG